MMLFSNQVGKSAKPRGGADVAGLAKIASGAAIITERERSAWIGDMLMRLGAGVAIKCANPNAVRPPADDERQASRKATGAYINPPVLRAIQKSPTDPQGSDRFVEPQPRPDQADLDFMWSPAVSPDLRANLIHAVKERTGAERIGTPFAMLQWDNSVSDLRDAIAELIERTGPEASALSRILDGGAGGKMAAARNAAFRRSAAADLVASIRKGAAVRKGRILKFFDVAKYGDGDEPDFDWRSYGYAQLHGQFDGEDRKTAELWRGSIARAPQLAGTPRFARWGAAMIRKYGLTGPAARGVVGYVVGSFS